MNVLRKVRWVPSLQLAGKWLADAGVVSGSLVEVEILNGKMIITWGNTI